MEGGFYMSQEEFKSMMDELVAQEEERLGVGSEDFLKRHREIMELIGAAERYQEERRQRVERQFIGAKEVAEILGVSESKAYSVIRDLNKELKERGYITVQGKVSRVFFQERCYGVEVSR
jgi:Fic family protein